MPALTAEINRPLTRHRPGWPGRAFLLAAATWLLAACSAITPDTDLAPVPSDMTVVADLAAGPSCGKIVLCIVGCGLDNTECDAKCPAGASPTEAAKAATLALCAALQCAGGDAGTGVPAILGCLISKCQKEVIGCDGLF